MEYTLVRVRCSSEQDLQALYEYNPRRLIYIDNTTIDVCCEAAEAAKLRVRFPPHADDIGQYEHYPAHNDFITQGAYKEIAAIETRQDVKKFLEAQISVLITRYLTAARAVIRVDPNQASLQEDSLQRDCYERLMQDTSLPENLGEPDWVAWRSREDHARFNTWPVPVRRQRVIIAGVPVLVYSPDTETQASFVYCHGGGGTLGRADSEDAQLTRIARDANCKVFSVDYPLAPEHPFPAAVDACCLVYKELWYYGRSTYNLDPLKICVGGVSTGGHIAASAVFRMMQLDVPLQVDRMVLIAPVINYDARSDDPLRPTTNVRVGPTAKKMLLYQQSYVRNAADHEGYELDLNRVNERWTEDVRHPPTLVAVMTDDVLCREGENFVQLHQRARHPYTLRKFEGPHPLWSYGGILPAARDLISEVCSFLGGRDDERVDVRA